MQIIIALNAFLHLPPFLPFSYLLHKENEMGGNGQRN